MGRVIYSMFMNIPADQEDVCVGHRWSWNSDHAIRLRRGHQSYAASCGATYLFFDDASPEFVTFHTEFTRKYPFLTAYEIINFFKIHLLYVLADFFDEFLYLDFDVIPFSEQSFFVSVDIHRGLCIKPQTSAAIAKVDSLGGLKELAVSGISKRSCAAKYANCLALAQGDPGDWPVDIFNTGVIGATGESLAALDYFGAGFGPILEQIRQLKEAVVGYNDPATLFAYDNETILAVLIRRKQLAWVSLPDRFHHICKRKSRVPVNTVLVHAIHKEFQHVWDQCS